MRLRADLISAPSNENREKELYMKSQERTSKWADNVKDLKKRKE
jgi:hypothetical protein